MQLVVQAEEDIALLHGLSLLEGNLERHTAGLRRETGTTVRLDRAGAGVGDGLLDGAALDGGHHDVDGLRFEEPGSRGEGDRHDDGENGETDDPASHGGALLQEWNVCSALGEGAIGGLDAADDRRLMIRGLLDRVYERARAASRRI